MTQMVEFLWNGTRDYFMWFYFLPFLCLNFVPLVMMSFLMKKVEIHETNIGVSILLLQKSKDDLLLHFSTDQLKNQENITPPFLENEPVGCSKVFFLNIFFNLQLWDGIFIYARR